MVHSNREELIHSQEKKWVIAIWIIPYPAGPPNKRQHWKQMWCMMWRGVTSKKSHFLCGSWQQSLSGLQKTMAERHRFWHKWQFSGWLSGGSSVKSRWAKWILYKKQSRWNEIHTPWATLLQNSPFTQREDSSFYSFIHSHIHSFSYSVVIHWVTEIAWSTIPGTRYIRQSFSTPPHSLFPVISDLLTLLMGLRLKLITFLIYSENNQD